MVVRDCEVSVVVVSSTAVTDPFGTEKLSDRLVSEFLPHSFIDRMAQDRIILQSITRRD